MKGYISITYKIGNTIRTAPPDINYRFVTFIFDNVGFVKHSRHSDLTVNKRESMIPWYTVRP